MVVRARRPNSTENNDQRLNAVLTLLQHPPAVHISDLVALYGLIMENILQKVPIPTDDKGYYFAIVHRIPLWDVVQRIADALYARGLVAEPKVEVWPSDDMAAEYLGYPRQFVRHIGTAR